MSVLKLQLTDALPDEKLTLHFEPEWSGMRSGRSDRQVFAYTVQSDSGNTYEAEVFINDSNTVSGYCGCPARVTCRHLKAILADVIEKHPEFGKDIGNEGAENG